jgi:cysteine desulfurase
VIYLDSAASAPLRPQARAAMRAAWELAGNPNSAHAHGRAARALLEDAREALSAVVGASSGEIVFTSGGTEANNLALRGIAAERRLVSAVEHPSIANIPGVEVLRVGGDGRVGLPGAPLAGALVSVQWANSETGVVQDIPELAAAAHGAGALFHTDAVQALGHLPLDFAGLGLDAMTITAHKIGGPVGIGALVVRRGLELCPQAFGGEQENRRRPGTVPVALAAGFAAAAQTLNQELASENSRLRGLHDRVVAGVRGFAPQVEVNCSEPCSPAIVNLTFPGARAADLLLLLDREGVSCSAGTACTAGISRPSPVLLAMGRSEADAAASLRFSFGWQTTADEVELALAALERVLRVYRGGRA